MRRHRAGLKHFPVHSPGVKAPKGVNDHRLTAHAASYFEGARRLAIRMRESAKFRSVATPPSRLRGLRVRLYCRPVLKSHAKTRRARNSVAGRCSPPVSSRGRPKTPMRPFRPQAQLMKNPEGRFTTGMSRLGTQQTKTPFPILRGLSCETPLPGGGHPIGANVRYGDS